MDARSLIEKLRRRSDLSEDEAYWIGKNLSSDKVSDAQVGAFAMAISLNGMGEKSRVSLTKGMCESGDILTWDLPGPILDKHSTGGVGDPVSLILAPALAACGAFVPMISGRGLGHTGGTLDKLEAIPGYICEVGPKRLNHVVKATGCAIVGAGAKVAPSDKRLYAVRDVTGTVNSIDLITASILSKKLAAGLSGLVLDVKSGSGAVMNDISQARDLAKSLVDVANGAGCKTTCVITDMSQPLADCAGNAVEIRAVMEVLTAGAGNKRLREVACYLGGDLLTGAGMVANNKAGRALIAKNIENGKAAEIFSRMISELGGPLDFDQGWKNCLPEAPVLREILPLKAGYISKMDTRRLGEIVVDLGGGRKKETDKINPAVGLSQIASLGQKIGKATPLMMLHAQNEAAAIKAEAEILQAIEITQAKPKIPSVILETVGR